MQAYRIDQENHDLPIEIGDKIALHEKNSGQVYQLVVTELDAETIKGKLDADSETVTTVRWDEISYVELRRIDGPKTALLITILLVLGIIANNDPVGTRGPSSD